LGVFVEVFEWTSVRLDRLTGVFLFGLDGDRGSAKMGLDE